MKTEFKNKKISGLLAVLPETVCYFDDEMMDGTSTRNQKLKKNMGYGKRRRAKKGTTSADLCVRGMNYLLENSFVDREEIGAVIVTSFTPDFYVPQVSNLIQSRCSLPRDIFTLDLWEGCSGYIGGLLQAFMLLEHMNGKKVLLFTADIINRLQENEGKYLSPPYGGDGASITILENTGRDDRIPFYLKEDGKGSELIALKHGAFWDLFRQKPSQRTGILMNPADSFRYFQKVIPELIQEMFSDNKFISLEDIDFVSLIQANKLSAKKIADKLQIPYEKIAINLVEDYGDISASENPLAIIDYYENHNAQKKEHCVLVCGYGAGLQWGATIITLENLICCKKIISEL